MIRDDFRIGHWTDKTGRTGCTAILCPSGTRASCDIRGSAPGTRETDLLLPEKHLQEINALVLTGGSAPGLGSAQGVVQFLLERGLGYFTPWKRIPIVPAAVIFDLGVGSSSAIPTIGSGYAACVDAMSVNDWTRQGMIGGGTGATTGKWRGMQNAMNAGLGIATRTAGAFEAIAVTIANPVGDIVDECGTIIAGARQADGSFAGAGGRDARVNAFIPPLGSNTIITAVIMNARLEKIDLRRIAIRMHDGIADAVQPAHTIHDGDSTFALSYGEEEIPVEIASELAVITVADSIRAAARSALPASD